MIKLAFLASCGYGKMEPEKVVKSLKRIGYDGVEWTLNHFNPRKKTSVELKKIVELCKNENLEISEIVVQQDTVTINELLRKDRIALGCECIEAAGQADINTVNMFTGPVPWDPNAPRLNTNISISTAWDLVFEAYDKWLAAAEKANVCIA